MMNVSWSQSKSRACGGARPSGSITVPAEGAFSGLIHRFGHPVLGHGA